MSYTFDVLNSPTTIEDADDSTYLCTVTCDANNNITELKEATLDEEEEELAVFYTNYSYDWANRLTEHRTRTYDTGEEDTQRTQRVHEWDAVGRLVKSGWRQYWESEIPAGYAETEHTYAGSRHIQNYDGSSTYGERWQLIADPPLDLHPFTP